MGIEINKNNRIKSVATAPIKPNDRRSRFDSMVKELLKGYFLILLVGALCILLLIVIMLFA